MSATQRARSGVPLDKRSLIVTVPGLPWWGVILLAAGVTTVGLVIDAVGGGGELTAVFSTFYFLGCLFAVVAASNNALFTAMAQPPLLLFAAVPIGHSLIGKDKSTALRDVAINIAYPLVNRFPVMLAATLVVLIIGGIRYFLLNQRASGPARTSRSSRPKRSPASAATDSAAPETGRRRRVSDAPRSAAPPAEPTRRRAPEPGDRPNYRDTATPDSRQRQRTPSEDAPRPPSPPPYRPRTEPRPERPEYPRAEYPSAESAREPAPRRRQSAPGNSEYSDSYGRRRSAEPTSRRSAEPTSRRSAEPASRHSAEPTSRHSAESTARHSGERMEPFFASGAADDAAPRAPRRRPPGVELPAYPPPRVRYRDREEP